MESAIQNTNATQLAEHFFRYETGKLTSVLTRIFGSSNMAMAEDVVQDTLLEAIRVWNYKGVPENPTAWLYNVAKNKALNIINRDKYKTQYISEVSHFLKSEWPAMAALIRRSLQALRLMCPHFLCIGWDSSRAMWSGAGGL